MEFTVERSIENKVLTVDVKFKAYGDSNKTAEEEQELVQAFGAPEVSVGGLFEGKFKADGVNVQADEAGESVSFVLANKKVSLNENFAVSHSVKLDEIKSDVKSDGTLTDEIKLAHARCLLFELEIQKRITEAADALQAKSIAFNDGYPKDFFA